ncbi:MAG: 50S ribosomal protein L37ae [Candidatus Pacearchaeota archaeon]
MGKTKKIKHAGRFSSRYGTKVKEKIRKIESIQRKKQKCPFCNKKKVKRLAKGIWYCRKCKKKFTSGCYYIQ